MTNKDLKYLDEMLKCQLIRKLIPLSTLFSSLLFCTPLFLTFYPILLSFSFSFYISSSPLLSSSFLSSPLLYSSPLIFFSSPLFFYIFSTLFLFYFSLFFSLHFHIISHHFKYHEVKSAQIFSFHPPPSLLLIYMKVSIS